ncbi:MAG: hypothetical protein WA913_10645 [Pricia sp.]
MYTTKIDEFGAQTVKIISSQKPSSKKYDFFGIYFAAPANYLYPIDLG